MFGDWKRTDDGEFLLLQFESGEFLQQLFILLVTLGRPLCTETSQRLVYVVLVCTRTRGHHCRVLPRVRAPVDLTLDLHTILYKKISTLWCVFFTTNWTASLEIRLNKIQGHILSPLLENQLHVCIVHVYMYDTWESLSGPVSGTDT